MYKAGDVLKDRYMILAILGRGGSGCVYLAEDFGIRKRWAIKEININIYGSRRFAESEITMLKSVDYHYFPRITDAWQDDTHFFIVSDYIEGISLKRLIEDEPLSRIKAYKISYQIAEAIEFLHLNNPPILYLDLKPDNIMVKPNGKIYLIDFGISTFLTGNTGGFGTRGYAAPEQYIKAECPEVDERADVYAFGRTYLAMRTGKNNCVTSLTKSERRFISKCTHQKPKMRFASMGEVKKHLNHINFFYTNQKRKAVILTLGILAMLLIGVVKKTMDSGSDTTLKMLKEASAYMEDGCYTQNGLAIIENYINSGVLEEREESYYSFIVARTLFENYGNYREAKRYFEKISEVDYPEKKYYLEMCSLETGFEYDEEKVFESLLEFKSACMMKKDSKEKYENLLFVAFCFEHYCGRKNGTEEAAGIYEYIEKCLQENDSDKNEWSDQILDIVKERRKIAGESG